MCGGGGVFGGGGGEGECGEDSGTLFCAWMQELLVCGLYHINLG